jgi:predicted enzyme related to lactoylglutathione lyase
MINFRVANLDALVAELKAAGIDLVVDPIEEEYGKFAWVMDPEGNKLELWEQK